MTSAALLRLENRLARTAARYVLHAERTGATVADLVGTRLPWYVVRNEAGDDPGAPEVAEILIYDEIGGSFGVSAKKFAEDVAAITAPRIHLRINSPGGSVFDALAMRASLRHHASPVTTFVDGLAASAATVVALAGDEIVMMDGSQMMIHDASMTVDANPAEMARALDIITRESDNLAALYQKRAGGDVADWRELMQAETWMFAAEAVEMGLADRAEGDTPASEPDMARHFDLTRYDYRYAGRRAAPAPRPPTRRQPALVRQQRSSGATLLIGTGTDASEAGEARRAAYSGVHGSGNAGQAPDPDDSPCGGARLLPFAAQLRVAPRLVEKNGRQMHRLEGEATVFGRWYDMYDDFGPYQERVHAQAADATLAAGPDVAFLTNHRGITMARTTNGTLELRRDAQSLPVVAYVNPDREDVRTLVSAIADGLVTEMSFAFMLEAGIWNEDFTEFTIMRFNLNRGDVSAVNYGANPYTSIAARSREILNHDLDQLPAGAARAAVARLQARADYGRPASGSTTTTSASGTVWVADVPVVPAPPDTLIDPAAALDGRAVSAVARWLAEAEPERSMSTVAGWVEATEADKLGPRP